MENTQLPDELVPKRLVHGIEDKRLAEKYLKTALSIGYKKFNWLSRKTIYMSKVILVFVAGATLVLLLLLLSIPEINVHEEYVKAEVEKVEIGNITGAVILKTENGVVLPIYISNEQAFAISLALNKVETPRPLTHELTINIIKEMGGKIRYVTIDKLVTGTYYATIVVDSKRIDARPSDGIALALRCDAPIYIKKSLLEEKGIKVEKSQVV